MALCEGDGVSLEGETRSRDRKPLITVAISLRENAASVVKKLGSRTSPRPYPSKKYLNRGTILFESLNVVSCPVIAIFAFVSISTACDIDLRWFCSINSKTSSSIGFLRAAYVLLVSRIRIALSMRLASASSSTKAYTSSPRADTT